MLRRKPSNASEKEPVQKKEQVQKKEPGQKKKLSLQRSSSFKDFMKHKPTSPVVSDKNKEFTLDETAMEGFPVEEHEKKGGKLGKKWRKVISRTMSRKTSKMVQKALAEEGGMSGDEASLSPVIDGLPDLRAGQRSSVCSSGSEDTTPVNRQLSGSSDRQSLDSGYSQRDSMRLEENGLSYLGPFCGRALVHTDFIPSPYDVESLKLQKGDIIHIIDKPPVGTWTGKLGNKVGSFKFIYVNILPDDGPPACRRQRSASLKTHCRGEEDRPRTLEELLESIGLSELCPLLAMHGFQTLEDFGGLRESHLNELNITNADQRAKILDATELLRDSEDESDEDDGMDSSEEDADKEPRDSGCFESSDNLENGRSSEEPMAQGELQKQTSSEEPDRESGEREEENQTESGEREEENQTESGEREEENQTEQLESVQEQLEELTVE